MQEFQATTSTKGQVTIPVMVRKNLGIAKGTIIYFKIVKSMLVGTLIKKSSILKYQGFLKDKDDKKSYEDILEKSYENTIKSRLKL